MGIFKLFSRKKEPLFKGRTFDYHEEDFSLTELVPSEVKLKSNSSNEPHLLEKKIHLSELEAILENSELIKFDNVTTGYASNQYDSEFSIAYGLEDDLIIIYERNKNLVDKIWFRLSFHISDEEYLSKFTKVVETISRKWNLHLIDHIENLVIDSKDHKVLTKFLLKRKEN